MGIKDTIMEGVRTVDDHLPSYHLDDELNQRISETVSDSLEKSKSLSNDNRELETLDTAVLDENLGKIAYTLDKGYMQALSTDYEVLPFNSQVTYAKNIRAIKIKKFVFNKDELVIDCMKNVVGAFSNTQDTLAVVVHRTIKDVSFYFVCKNVGEGKNSESANALNLLNSAFLGNFSGSDCEKCEYTEKENSKDDDTRLKDELFFLQNPSDKNDENNENVKAIAVLSAIPSDKSEKYVSQGIEKILNGVVPKKEDEEYSVVFLAEALQQSEIRSIIDGFEEMATAITPFASHQFQNSINESDSKGEMNSVNESISHSINKSHSVNANVSVSHSFSVGGGPAPAQASTSVSVSAGYGYNWGKSESNTAGTTQGTNHNIIVGSGKSTTFTYKSYLVTDLLQKLEAVIKRLTIAQATGLWRSSAYILAKEKSVAVNVAQSLNGLISGDESFVESSAIQSWSYAYNEGEETDFDRILTCVNHFSHPVFINKFDKSEKHELVYITPTANLSTTEFAKIVSLPKHALPGIPVLECAGFGRTVGVYNVKHLLPNSQEDIDNTPENEIRLGNICHMYSEENLPVKLNIKNLSSHTFITGSTGSGKSNTIYHLLSELTKCDWEYKKSDDTKESEKVHFLVVEPAKGEYKNVFGGNPDVSVYGTNPDLTPLLRINPFSFPHGNEAPSKNIHILEHLDRLIEIFNVCWPMYAAMPAVLKEAVEKSYEDCGWNLTESANEYGSELYPTFADVTRNIRTIIDSSEYDAENKGAYKGSLITRLKSLTNGINGLIFTTDELAGKDLFDENVIVDLSRVGSAETKSLIMGLLVLKLQEHRMTSGMMNAPLRHVTVLEEAHNLLKRTSTEQSQESGNLLGKSVEMLTNSIAEMRTYGEGFIIADQAPALLDMAVIRNTNTKIIMRLPDKDDRELVGKAANLNDDQITELAKLPCGVAAVYQNEWVEAVLCKVHDFTKDEKGEKKHFEPYIYKKTDDSMKELKKPNKSQILRIVSLLLTLRNEKEIEEINSFLNRFSFSAASFVGIKRYIENKPKKCDFVKLAPVVSSLLPDLKKSILDNPVENKTIQDVRHNLQVAVFNLCKDEQLRRNILQCILNDYAYNDLGQPQKLVKLKRQGEVDKNGK